MDNKVYSKIVNKYRSNSTPVAWYFTLEILKEGGLKFTEKSALKYKYLTSLCTNSYWSKFAFPIFKNLQEVKRKKLILR